VLEEIEPGTLLHDQSYKVLQKYSEGGMGKLYLVQDLMKHRLVIIKVARMRTPEARKQFQREAAYLRKLQHHGLPRVWDYFGDTQREFLVMEFIPDEDLQAKVRREGRQPEWLVLRWADELLIALDYLHKANPPIIHRDIKPSNLKLRQDETLVLVDFGIAKEYIHGQATVAGAEAISPGYSPPEQHRVGGRTDARSDIYSTGATLYFLLTGQAPPLASNLEEGTARLVPPKELVPGLSSMTSALLLRALEVKPKRRWSSAAEMHQMVDAALKAIADIEEGIPLPPIPIIDSPEPDETLFKPLTPVEDRRASDQQGSRQPLRKIAARMSGIARGNVDRQVSGKNGEFGLSLPVAATPVRVAASPGNILYVAWDCGQIQAYELPNKDPLCTVAVANSSRAKILDLTTEQSSTGQSGCYALILDGGQCRLVFVTTGGRVDTIQRGLSKHSASFAHRSGHLYLVEAQDQSRNGAILYSVDDDETLIGIPECETPVDLLSANEALYLLGISKQGKYCIWKTSENVKTIREKQCWTNAEEADEIYAAFCPYYGSLILLVKDKAGRRWEKWKPFAEKRTVFLPKRPEFQIESCITASKDRLFTLVPSTSSVHWYGCDWLEKNMDVEFRSFEPSTPRPT
jgi:serine/threonine-protein kinase